MLCKKQRSSHSKDEIGLQQHTDTMDLNLKIGPTVAVGVAFDQERSRSYAAHAVRLIYDGSLTTDPVEGLVADAFLGVDVREVYTVDIT